MAPCDPKKHRHGMAGQAKHNKQLGLTTTTREHHSNNTGTSTAQQQQRHDQQNTQQQHQSSKQRKQTTTKTTTRTLESEQRRADRVQTSGSLAAQGQRNTPNARGVLLQGSGIHSGYRGARRVREVTKCQANTGLGPEADSDRSRETCRRECVLNCRQRCNASSVGNGAVGLVVNVV